MELIDNRGQNKQILLGEVKVVDNFISADKIRMLLLKTLREKNELHILDMAAKRRKKHKNQISGLIISMGYETEIQEF